jgi:LysM repeat protein
MALLMQGCKPTAQEPAVSNIDTNLPPTTPAFVEPTNVVVMPETNVPVVTPLPETNYATMTPVVATPEPISVVTPPATVTEHKIVRGDTLDKVAKHYGVTRKAIQDANPGVDPTRLQIGKTLQIPAAAPSSTIASAPGGTKPDVAPGQTYKVKSGDNLLKIAKVYGVSTKAIRAANNMRTDRIRVGQTLKIPTKTGNGGSTSDSSTSSLPTGTP